MIEWSLRICCAGLPASIVVVSHYLGSFWLYRSAVGDLTGLPVVSSAVLPTPVYANWITAAPGMYKGGFGVAMFFLISGFVIPFSFSHYTRRGFVVARVFRLWPTYAVGLR